MAASLCDEDFSHLQLLLKVRSLQRRGPGRLRPESRGSESASDRQNRGGPGPAPQGGRAAGPGPARAFPPRPLPQPEQPRPGPAGLPRVLPPQPEEDDHQGPAGEQPRLADGSPQGSDLAAPADRPGLEGGHGDQLGLAEPHGGAHLPGPAEDGGPVSTGGPGGGFHGDVGAEQRVSGHHPGRSGPDPGPALGGGREVKADWPNRPRAPPLPPPQI